MTLRTMVPSFIVRLVLSPFTAVIFVLLAIMSVIVSLAGEDRVAERMMDKVMYFIRGKE